MKRSFLFIICFPFLLGAQIEVPFETGEPDSYIDVVFWLSRLGDSCCHDCTDDEMRDFMSVAVNRKISKNINYSNRLDHVVNKMCQIIKREPEERYLENARWMTVNGVTHDRTNY